MPRALLASSILDSLTAEGWRVALLVLLVLPKFREERFWFGPHPFTVQRGEIFCSEEEIAARAHVTRKVVRTVLRRLEAAHLVSRRKVHPSGQCPHIITVLDYELSQTLPSEGANGRANGGAVDWASEGPEAGQRGAPVKPQVTEGEPQEPLNLSPSPTAPAAGRRRKGKVEEPDSRHHQLQERLEAAFLEVRGDKYGFQRRDAKALTTILQLSAGDQAEAERRWRVGLGEVGFRRCDAIHDLATKWNAYTGGGAQRPSGAPVPAMAAGNLGRTGGFGS
jgi:hypothetical protein